MINQLPQQLVTQLHQRIVGYFSIRIFALNEIKLPRSDRASKLHNPIDLTNADDRVFLTTSTFAAETINALLPACFGLYCTHKPDQ